jgi:hypothetical protein
VKLKNIMPLSDSISVLERTAPPPMAEKRKALEAINGESAVLRSQLGEPHARFEWNPARAVAALTELKKRVAAGGLTPTPTAIVAAPAVAATATAATLPADVRPLADYLNLNRDDRRMFCQDNLKLTLADFKSLSLHARMEFAKNGGRLADDTANPRNLSLAARSFGNS